MLADYPDNPAKIDGGLQAVTFYLAAELSKMPEVDLHVISFRRGLDRQIEQNRGDLRLYSLPLARLGTITAFRQDQQTLNACLEKIKPDLVHSQGGGHHGIIATRSKFPSVVTIHGIHSREAAFLPGIHRRLRARLEGWLGERVYIRGARDTILISPYVSAFYDSKLTGRKFLIPNPVDDRFFNVKRQKISRTVLFAGRLYALKGVTDLIRAVAKVENRENLRVILAGAHQDENYLKLVHENIALEDLTGIVETPGILETEDLLRELSTCSCLVLPSYQETAPMVIQEAMAAGVPVIASDICGIPHQIVDEKTGYLIAPGNVDELAGKLNMLLDNAALCDELGKYAKEIADKRYRSSIVAQKTLEVYLQVIEKTSTNSQNQS